MTLFADKPPRTLSGTSSFPAEREWPTLHDFQTPAAAGTLAVGEWRIDDGVVFSNLRPLPISTPTLTIGLDGVLLCLYDVNASRIYVHDMTDLTL